MEADPTGMMAQANPDGASMEETESQTEFPKEITQKGQRLQRSWRTRQ